MEIIGLSVRTLGELLIGYTAIRVHWRFWKEHSVDEKVFSEMKGEQTVGIIGIALLLLGFALELIAKI